MVQISTRSLRKALCVLATLLLCTWISGCALWPFGGKVTRSASNPSTRSTADATSSSGGKGLLAPKIPESAGKKEEKTGGETAGLPPDKSERAASASTETTGSSSRAQSSGNSDSQDSEPLFKKHDHSKYVRTIRNKAIDRLNKHRNASHAILCRNRTTDQWSLTVYFKGARGYSYISYDWDGVDEHWVKVFEAKNLPVTRWRQHVRYSTADKECSPLKGGTLPVK